MNRKRVEMSRARAAAGRSIKSAAAGKGGFASGIRILRELEDNTCFYLLGRSAIISSVLLTVTYPFSLYFIV